MNNIFSFMILITGLVTSQAFNVEIEIPHTYEGVLAGENLWWTTKVVNFDNHERMDVNLLYEVYDSEGNTHAKKSETVAIETQASFVGNIRIPSYLSKGLYFLKVTLNSSLGVSHAENTFEVIEEETANQLVIKFSLFDIIVDIPDKYKAIHPGDQLLTSIKLINVGSSGRVDVFLDYAIIGQDGETIFERKETVAVETQANFIRTFDIPKNTKPGTYKIQAQLTYADGKYAVSDNTFEVIDNKSYRNWYYAMGILLLVTLIVIPIWKHPPDFEKITIKRKVASIVKKKLK